MGQKTDVIIEAITPVHSSVSAQKLHYHNFRTALRQAGFLSALKKSGEVLIGRRDVPSLDTVRYDFYTAYLLNASYRLQRSKTPFEKLFWTQQFSVTSIKLFGRPQSKMIAPLAAEELAYFTWVCKGIGSDQYFAGPLLRCYAKLAGRAKPSASAEQKYQQTLDRIRDYYFTTYPELFACFDTYAPTARLTPDQLFESFTRALNLLKQRDSAWMHWKIVRTKNANLSVSARYRRICIGERRVSVPAQEVRGLFAHEVLVHALRAVNGQKIAKELRFGLDDYLVAEEGLGVLVESAINGGVAPKAKDRYLDIALALGGYRQKALAREELFEIAFVRAVLRSVSADATTESLDDIERSTWQHINRIYRGTRGDKYIGVFTKDIAYYEGLVRMARYLEGRFKKHTTEQAMNYVLCGKFDPSNKQHRKQLNLLTK